MRPARTGSMQRAIKWALFPHKPSCVIFGQALGFQGHYDRPGIQEPVVMVVTVNDRVAHEPGRWIAERYRYIDTPGQGLECCGLVSL